MQGKGNQVGETEKEGLKTRKLRERPRGRPKRGSQELVTQNKEMKRKAQEGRTKENS